MKLHNKIFTLTIVQLVAIFIFGIYQIQSLYATQKKAFEQKTSIQTEIVQKRFEDTLSQLQKSAQILINSQEVITGVLTNDTDMLYNWSKLFLSPLIDKIHFMDLDGTIISRGESEFRFSDDVSSAFYFQQARHNNTFLGIDVIDGQECLVYAKRIDQYGEKPIGVISVALIIDQEFLHSLIEGTTMNVTYQSTRQNLSTTGEKTLMNASSLHVMLQSGSIKEATFQIGLTSEGELNTLQQIRQNFFVGITFAFIVLLIVLHLTLLKHLKEYDSLTRLLIDFNEDRLSIKNFIKTARMAIQRYTTPEVQKIAEALFKMGQKVADTQNSLKLLSTIDQLTTLYNRRKLEEVMEQKIKEASRDQPFAAIMLDIDHFKKINDTYGHEIGDTVLIQVAEVMKNTIRASDIIGRWGGEEFLLVLPATSLEGAVTLAEELRCHIETHPFSHYDTLVTVSLGVTVYREGDTQNTLLKRADTALYKAKNAGRNGVHYAA